MVEPDRAVIVIGAGPVGATAALLLAAHGIPTVVIERRTSPQSHPAAHVLSTRSLEIWRQLGLDRDIRRLSAPVHELRAITYCTTVAGLELGRVPILDLPAAQLDAVESASPTRAAHLSQNVLEELLWDRLRGNDLVDFRVGWEYIGQRGDNGHVVVLARDADSVTEVRARFVVAADGAASPVRRDLGIALSGPVLQHVVSVHFSADLERFCCNRRGPVLWTHTSKGLGTIIIHRSPEDLVFQIPYFPPLQTLADYPPQVCKRLIRNAIGDPSVEVVVKSVQSWAMTAQVADRYRSGRTFLAGDAAHRFPPTGGFGLNTGVADVHNLVWKLAWVLTGRAGGHLLDSYDTERRPIGRSATDASVRNFDGLLDVLAAPGIPRTPVRSLPAVLGRAHSARAREHRGSVGRSVMRWALAVFTRLGYQPLRLAAARGPLGQRVRRRAAAAIAKQGPHYRSWGRDLGTVYSSGALLPDGSTPPPTDPEFYTPAVHVGGRLPHAWVDDGVSRRSTLDQIAADRPTLLVAEPLRPKWEAAISTASVALAAIADTTLREKRWGLTADAALLVRPDHHIAARLHGVSAQTAFAALSALHVTAADQDITA